MTSTIRRARAIYIPEIIVAFCLSVLLPFLVHLLPAAGVPLGARLLPIFFAPLLAIFFAHPVVAIVVALFAPLANYALIGMPAQQMVVLLTIELVVFVLIAYGLHQRFPKLFVLGPVAYIGAKAIAALVLLVVPIMPIPPAQYFSNGLITALPGLAILLLLTVAGIQFSRGRNAD